MRLVTIAASLVALAVTARGDTVIPLLPEQEAALTPIDRLPNQQHLSNLFGADAAEDLATIATSMVVDLGVQLRAIRSLAGFCPDAPTPCGVGTITHDTLRALLATYLLVEEDGDPTTVNGPRDVLRLRAVIEALGVSAGSAALDADVDELAKFLDHPSRDIRAATAKALGALCNTRAIPPLRAQLQNETTGVTGKAQVRLAISAALRDLQSGQCTPP